jgi:hypothetical protein
VYQLTLNSELAKFHKDAPSMSQNVTAMYLVVGELYPRPASQPTRDSEDVDMDGYYGTQEDPLIEDHDGYVEEGEEIVQTTMMLVNEKDLESMFAYPMCYWTRSIHLR